MNLEKFYEVVEGDYKEAGSRLMNDAIIKKFLNKFLNDPTYDALKKAADEKNDGDIFLNSHSLKGVAGNLSLGAIGKLSSEICEAYRVGNENIKETFDLDDAMTKLSEAYTKAIEAINELD